MSTTMDCKIFKYVAAVFVLLGLATVANGQFPNYKVKNGTLNTAIKDEVVINEEIVYYYPLNAARNLVQGNTHIRIEAEVEPTVTQECPILITIRHNQGLTSWELPVVYTDSHNLITSYFTAGKSLCIEQNTNISEQFVLIEVSSCSRTPKWFTLSMWIRDDFLVGISERRNVIASPTAPIFHRFDHPVNDRADFVLIYVESDDSSTCATVSVQAPSCPVLDQENNIQFQGYWQTMTSKAGITIRTNRYPNGFFLIIVVLKDDQRCQELSGIDDRNSQSRSFPTVPREKNLTFAVYEVIGQSDYVLPTLIPLLFIFGLIIFVFLIFTGFQHRKHKLLDESNGDFDTQPDAIGVGPYKSRFQSCLNIADVEKIDCKFLVEQSNRYYWSLLIIAVFYCVPVFQLIINYLKVVYRTGEQDICYYNFYCARPLGYVMDFNHIYSNIAYVILGITFIVLVKLRQNAFYLGNEEEYLELSNSPGRFRKIFPLLNSNLEYGVLQYFGLFYAMGLALTLEGILSGAYHICPNQSNFQFDTSFMYAIAFLGIVKIYQFRHPVYISANITFVSLAVVASSAVLGLLFNNLAFKISFSVVHLAIVFILLLYLYYFGYIKDDEGNIVTGWIGVFSGIFAQSWRSNFSDFEVPHWSRLVLPFLTTFFNVLIVIMIWTVMQDSNFATQILAIFVVNLFVYTTYYIIMKWIHNEYQMKLWIQPMIYLILSAGLWIISLYYFQNALSSWEKSPAESKTQNAFCTVLDFYDNHDLWHFLSAGALFCSFMLLLTIDDDLVTRRHDRISVF